VWWLHAYRVDESHLTGESDDVVKEPPAAAAAGSSGSSGGSSGLSSCLCMSGSKVLEGFGRMLVLAVGPNSQQVRTGTVGWLSRRTQVDKHEIGTHAGVSHCSAAAYAGLLIFRPLVTTV
jgi:hypothetical protein